MKITLAESLTFGGLIDAEVLTGRDHLDNLVESVTTIEVTEDAMVEWVFKDQLYISAMYSVKDDIDKQIHLVKMLHEKQCSGLVLCHIGIWMKSIHPDLVKVCEEIGFPLIKANPQTMFMDILYPILNRTQKDNDLNSEKTFVEINKDVLNMILDTEDVEIVFAKIAKLYHLCISYLDSYCNCLYSNKKLTVSQAECDYLRENFNVLFAEFLGNAYIVRQISGEEKLIHMVRTRRTSIGFLVLDVPEESRVENIGAIAEMISTAFALMAGRKTWTLHMEDHYVEEYLSDLLTWNFRSSDEAIRRAQDIGINIQNKGVLVLINLNELRDKGQTARYTSEIRRVVLPKLRQIYQSIDKDVALILKSDQIFALLEGKKEPLKKANQKCKQYFQQNRVDVSIGVSDMFTDPWDIPGAYYQACQAYIIGREYAYEEMLFYYKDLFFMDKIRQMNKKKDAREYAEELLQPLVNYDKDHDTNLLDTLHVLLMNNNDVKHAAETLYTHRNTVIYRRNRIEEVYGYSPLKMPYSISFFIAFDMLK